MIRRDIIQEKTMNIVPTSPIAYALQHSIEALKHSSKDAVQDDRKNKADFYQKDVSGAAEIASPVYDSEGKTVTQAPSNVDVDL
jgi:hypothetical protein